MYGYEANGWLWQIYSADAVATLALLDLHPTVPDIYNSGNPNGREKLEIFEAGTGHGAFTLNLARAIHAANPNGKIDGVKEIRRAIVHTLDRSPAYSAHAQNMIKSFRKGMYLHNIDFHVGTIEDFINKRFSENGRVPFLDHAILDLPGAHNYVDIVTSALKPNGSLLIFAPQITQINTCVLHSKKIGIPVFLDAVIELGDATGVGGREWDVRPIRPRAYLQAVAEKELQKVTARENGDEVESEAEVASLSESSENSEDGWEMVCRPKVGGRVQGGGFVGQWRKMVPQRPFSERRLNLDSPVETILEESSESSAGDEEVTSGPIEGSEQPLSRPVTE